MHRMTILYGRPEDPKAFDAYYRDVHLPIARKMRGLAGWELTWIDSQQGDVGPALHLVVDLWADDEATMDRVLASEAGRAASADVPNFATGGVTFLRGEAERVTTAPEVGA